MKKSLSLLVAIAMVFSMFATSVFAAEELTATQKYEGLVKAGIFEGYPDGQAHLDLSMTRAQAAKIIAILAGYKAGVTSPDAGFTDVAEGHWAKPFVDYAANLGIVQGVGAGKYDPSSEVTIEELAKLAVEALKKLGYTLKEGVAVEGAVSEWAKDYVAIAVANGIIAAQTDYKVPATREILVLASYSAYVALQVPAAITVESVKATNSKTLTATFNIEVGTAVANDFTVHTKDDVYSINAVDSVKIDGKTVKVTLTEALDEETTYVVVASGVVSKEHNLVLASTSNEVTYKATEAASIAFSGTSVANEGTVGVVIKDANGNDVTADYELTNGVDIAVETSNETVVGTDLVAENLDTANNKALYSIVNVILLNDDGEETSIETGNTIISVYNTLATAAKIGVVTLADDFKSEDLALYKSETDTLIAQILDQNGDEIAVAPTFRSQNPTVAVIDQETGEVFGVKAGTATIVVQATFNGKTVSKTVTLTVRDDAKLTSLALELPNSKLVKGSELTQDLTVKFLDQYNEEFAVTEAYDIDFTINKDGIVDGLSKPVLSGGVSDSDTLAIGDKKFVYTLTPGETKGSGTLTVAVNGIKKTISVSLVEAGAFAGYAAVVSDTTLDLNFADDDLSDHPGTVAVAVYEKDVNGNYIAEVASGDIDLTETSEAADSAVTTSGVDVDAQAVGTETVTVKVGNAKVATFKFTVVNTAKSLTKVVQVKNAITVDNDDSDLFVKLFGDDEVNGAFIAYNQYGAKIEILNTAVDAFSSKKSVVDVSTWTAGDVGTATLTISLGGNLYTITVKVVD
ncbi:Ig-like domain-containing protein [Paenibacillus sp. YIM B09110]|uniref:Ig-like domain-containing protein n=1 Tax=Paenibacillus sp. YIM B09110 TaxID=3126102 RepID=UPI00301BD424